MSDKRPGSYSDLYGIEKPPAAQKRESARNAPADGPDEQPAAESDTTAPADDQDSDDQDADTDADGDAEDDGGSDGGGGRRWQLPTLGGGQVAGAGAGWVLGVLIWGWVVLPFVKGGPKQVVDTLRAKFVNKAADGSELP